MEIIQVLLGLVCIIAFVFFAYWELRIYIKFPMYILKKIKYSFLYFVLWIVFSMCVSLTGMWLWLQSVLLVVSFFWCWFDSFKRFFKWIIVNDEKRSEKLFKLIHCKTQERQYFIMDLMGITNNRKRKQDEDTKKRMYY